MQIDGAFHCGKVSFTARIDPSRVLICLNVFRQRWRQPVCSSLCVAAESLFPRHLRSRHDRRKSHRDHLHQQDQL